MASGWNVWVWLSGGGCGWKLLVSGCFPHITYISLLLWYLLFFAAASLLLFHKIFVKMIFRSCLCYFCAIVEYKNIGDDKKNLLKFINK